MLPTPQAHDLSKPLSLTMAIALGGGLVAAIIWALAPPLQVDAQPPRAPMLTPAAPSDQTIVLTLNDDYYDAASVAITQVTSTFIDEEEAWARYMSGELDTVTPPPSEVVSITESAVYSDQIRIFPSSATIWLAFSMDAPPVDNAHLRAALASAINREQLINDLGTYDIPALTLTPPGHFGHVDGSATGVGYPYSPTQAAAYLTASGYTGTPTITLSINADWHQALADSIVGSWHDTLGISAAVEILPIGEMLQLPVEARPNLFRIGWLSDFPDADNFHAGAMGIFKPWMHYESPPYDALVAAAAAETDVSARQDLYIQAEAQLVMSDTAIIPLYYFADSRVTRPDLDRTYRSAGAQQISEWSFDGAQRPLEIAWGAPATLDPALVSDQVSADYVSQLFLGLTTIDKDTGEAMPALATSWDVSDDAAVFTFTLRSDVDWTDGQPVTAHDVEYAILRALDPSTGAPIAWRLYALKNAEAFNSGDITDPDLVGVEALNDTTVVFTTEEPAAYLPAILATPTAFPVPEWAIAAHGARWTEAGNIVTNGPYRLTHRDLTPALAIGKESEGLVTAGGELVFTIGYANLGGADAEETRILDEMDGLAYISDTGPFTHTGTGVEGDPLIWHLHTLTGYTEGEFEVTVEVTADLGDQLVNQVWIETSTSNDMGQNREAYWSREVELPWTFVNYSEDRAGAAYPVGHTFWVTLTDELGGFKASGSASTCGPDGAGPDGAWYPGFAIERDDWTEDIDIVPGDYVYFGADDGYTSTVRVGTITGTLDAEADTVEGKITDPSPRPIPVLSGLAGAWGFDWQEFSANQADGEYLVQFEEDLERGWSINVLYFTADGDRVINTIEPLDLVLEVNYGHDWVQSRYEAGHTGTVTVTESDGETVKATAAFTTEHVPWWGGDTGFQTEWEDWSPSQPDIMPGDYVYGQISTGYTATVHIGTISGQIHTATNSISGTVYAPWLTDTVDVACGPYVENGVWKDSTAEPDGSVPYFCQWDLGSEWEMEPGDDLAVSYGEPDADQVTNVFVVPYPYRVFLPLAMKGD